MKEALAEAVRATASLKNQARNARAALRALEEEIGEPLGTFEVNTPIPDELLDHIRLAAEGQGRIYVHVTAVRGTDQGDTHDRTTRNGRGHQGDGQQAARVGIQPGNGRAPHR